MCLCSVSVCPYAPISTHPCVCVSPFLSVCVSVCHLYPSLCPSVPLSVSVCLHIPISIRVQVCMSQYVPISLSVCPHFYPSVCPYVPISVCMSPFPSVCPRFNPSMGLHGSPRGPHLGFPPPNLMAGAHPSRHLRITPTPIPPPIALRLLWVSYRFQSAFREHLGFVAGFPAPICIQRAQHPPPPPLQPHCSSAGCCDPGAEPAA